MNNYPIKNAGLSKYETAASSPSTLFTVALIALFHIRFLFILVLDTRTLILDIVFYALIFAAILTLKLNKYVFLLIPIAIISFFNPAGRNLFLLLSSSYIIADKLPLKKILIINIICIIAVFAAVLLMVKMDILKEHIMTGGFFTGRKVHNIRLRSDLGFGNPNRVAMLAYSLFINVYLFLNKRHNKTFLITVTLLSAYIYSLTDSRTFIIAFIIFILTAICINNKAITNLFVRSKKILAVFPFLFLALIMYAASINYHNLTIQILTSGRLGLYTNLFSQTNIIDFLIGTNLINEKTIDNSYIHLLFSAGLFGYIITGILWVKTINQLKVANIILYPILTSIMIYGTSESIWTTILCYGNMIIWIIMIKSTLFRKSFEQELEAL